MQCSALAAKKKKLAAVVEKREENPIGPGLFLHQERPPPEHDKWHC